MLYTESFKKQVVKKVLSPGVIAREVCRKLHVSETSLRDWKARYGAEMQALVQEVDLGPLLEEKEVDVDELLREADRGQLCEATGSSGIASHIDELARTGKAASAFNERDKYAIVKAVRSLPGDKRGGFLRRHGLDDRHIALWEEELIAMSKATISRDEYTRKLEEENKLLKKQLAAAERDKHELEVIIELKKKYPTLFKPDAE